MGAAPHTHTPTNTLIPPMPGQEEAEAGSCVGLDVGSGEPADPHLGGIFDNYLVKRQILQRCAVCCVFGTSCSVT